MRLVHYTKAPIEALRPVPVEKRRGRHADARLGGGDMKPGGLWVSDEECEHNWKWWCEAEDFGCSRYRFAHPVTIVSNANVLHIATVEEIDAFSAQYGAGWRLAGRHEYIDWEAVTARYDGIVITPYLWERRLGGPAWYYSWDCASGCIWNVEVITLGPAYPVTFSPTQYPVEEESE